MGLKLYGEPVYVENREFYNYVVKKDSSLYIYQNVGYSCYGKLTKTFDAGKILDYVEMNIYLPNIRKFSKPGYNYVYNSCIYDSIEETISRIKCVENMLKTKYHLDFDLTFFTPITSVYNIYVRKDECIKPDLQLKFVAKKWNTIRLFFALTMLRKAFQISKIQTWYNSIHENIDLDAILFVSDIIDCASPIDSLLMSIQEYRCYGDKILTPDRIVFEPTNCVTTTSLHLSLLRNCIKTSSGYNPAISLPAVDINIQDDGPKGDLHIDEWNAAFMKVYEQLKK